MNHRILLSLFTIPTLAGSLLAMSLMAGPAFAVKPIASSSNQASCDLPIDSSSKSFNIKSIRHTGHQRLIASATSIPAEDSILDFSAAESDAAATLFGCDCPSCINALRQLQNRSLLNQGQGHCWTALQQRVSSSEMQQVLQTLEAEEARREDE